MTDKRSRSELAAELGDLRARLAEAEDALRAIRNGEVDAVVVTGGRGEQVYSLAGADRIYRQLIESMSEGAVTLSADGVILYCNHRLAELLGRPLDQVMGTALRDYLPPAYQQALDAILVQVGTTPSRLEINLRSSNGHLVPIYLSASSLRCEGEEPVICLVLTDLTEQRHHEHIVAEERLARLILEQAAEAIVVCDEQGQVIRASRAAQSFCDGSPLLRRFSEAFPLRTNVSDRFHVLSVLQGETLRDANVALERNGRTFALILNAGPLKRGEKILGCVVTLTDITARKRSQDRVQLSRDLMELLNYSGAGADQIRSILQLIKKRTGMEAVGIRLQDGDDFPYLETNGFPDHFVQMERHLCAKDRDGKIVRDREGNPVLECMCGNILRCRTDPKLPFFTEGGSFWSNCTTELLASTSEEDLQAHTRNRCNSEGYESVALIPLRTENTIIGLLQLNDHRRNRFDAEMIHFFEGIGASIGIALARQRADEMLCESEARLRDIVSSMADWVWEMDERGVYTYSSEKGNELLGLSREQVIGKTPFDFMPPDEAMRVGSIFSDIVARRAPIKDLENWNTRKNGEMVFLQTNGVPILDGAGNFKGYRGVDKDITARKQAEQKRENLEEQLRASQKMEAIGSLAGGVAHDFNNLLSVILSYTEFAMEGVADGEPIKNDLLEVKKAGERAAALTRQLLAFSRKQVLQPATLDLNQVATRVEKMLRRILSEDIDFVQVLAPDLGMVQADPGQIEQVLMNLVVNARDAMPEGGKLTIETSNVEIDEGYSSSHVAVTPGPYVQIAVTDTGCGMDEQTKARLFEPFFTTKEKGKGTGLGLSTVYGIVKQSGGNIWVYSEPGRGTTLKVYLPRELSATTATAIKPSAVPKRATGTETILVVEDEAALLKLARRTLVEAGYTVLTAADGDDAIRICAHHAGDIQILLTDVVMPRMSGRVLAQELIKTRPTMKVLYMSGYTGNAIGHHGVLDAGTHFLAKPFTSADLMRKVREVLDCGLTTVTGVHEQAVKDVAEVKQEQALDEDALRGLPEELLSKLRRAVTAARYDEIAELIETIRVTEPNLATVLRKMADLFDYDGLRSLLGQGKEK